MGINAKKKGNVWENKLKNWLLDNGIKAWKDVQSGGGNREKGDVGNNLDMTIESKAAKNIKLMDWWKQVSHSASIQQNQPVLFIHQDGMPDNNWLVVMHSEDWIEMLKLSLRDDVEEIEIPKEYSRDTIFKIDRAIQANKEAKKALEKEAGI